MSLISHEAISPRSGSRRLPGWVVAHAGASPAISALQTGLNALPIAAAVIVADAGEPRLHASNTLFQRLLRKPATAPHLDELTGPLRRHLAAGDAAAPRQLRWQEPGPGGRHFNVHLSCLEATAELGARVMITLIDATSAVEAERSLRIEMMHDSLSGLPNRLAFTEAVEAAVGRAGVRSHLAVLMLNLSRFSRINEGVGALAGDELIITVARRLKLALRPGDMLARMGADEFALLVQLGDRPDDLPAIAADLQDALARPLRLSELEIRVDCAIGCARWHAQAPLATDMIRNAQVAMKRAKTSGQVELYQPGEAGQAHRRFSLETDLRRAIEADQLSLAYQPLIDLSNRRIIGFETLTRWQHPDRGAVSPIEFISVAEESGLIVPLGRWVLDRSLRTLAEWDRAHGGELPIYLGVNVSAVQLQRDQVPQVAREALAEHGISGARLTLELTESSIVGDPQRAGGVLDALKALDCRIAMDDFGTGYSSLSYLQRLPIDILKIDRAFVSGMLNDRDSAAIVRAILSLASALGMATIAEGIESEPLATMLAGMGARTGQGFHFAKPMPAADALALMRLGGGEVPLTL